MTHTHANATKNITYCKIDKNVKKLFVSFWLHKYSELNFIGTIF